MKKILFLITLLLVNAQASGEDYKLEEIEFVNKGDQLSGSIVFPTSRELHSAVVFVHGSGKQTRNIQLAKRFASEGIAALVYDKRGVGRSGGRFESNQSVSETNINLLAEDSIAALNFLHNHPQTRGLPIGFAGISQAGWIIPVAAEKTNNASFMVIWSGPVCKVSEEDIFSLYTADLDEAEVPSYDKALKSRKTKYSWPRSLGKDSDPSDSLAKLKIPGLWIFGENDGSVPVDLSIRRLKNQIAYGRQYNYVLFSGLGHNNIPETFTTAANWIERLSALHRASNKKAH